MNVEPPPLQLSSGATSLLRIARQNDPQLVMTNNATLMVTIDLASGLFWCKPTKAPRAILDTLGLTGPTASFLELVSAFLCCVRRAVLDDFHRNEPSEDISYATDFDRHVLHAFSLTLADAAWPKRFGRDFDGPPASTVIGRLQRFSQRRFLELLALNYVGDILQDYFARAGVRRRHPKLPVDRESALRLVDAQDVVEHMVACISARGGSLETSKDFMLALRTTLRSVQ